MQGSVVTVFGADGFVGRYVVQTLLARGARVKAAVLNTNNAMHLKPLGNLGQVELLTADVRKPGSVFAAIDGSDAVVNLVGSFADMDAINAKGAGTVAAAAKAASVKALVHVSAIGANADSDAKYARSKAAGEAAMRAAFPSATIIRPSIIFGREDRFINRFAGLIRALPVLPVIGAETKFQPVFVGDVANAIAAALDGVGSETLELGGPETYSMLELNQWIANAIGHKPIFAVIPNFVAKPLAAATGWLPFAPINSDQLKMLGHDNVVAGTNGLIALDIVPTPLDSVAHDWLNLYRKHGRFSQTGKTQAA